MTEKKTFPTPLQDVIIPKPPSGGLLDIPIPLTPNGLQVLEKRYLRKGDDGKTPNETVQQMFWRVASNVAAHSCTIPPLGFEDGIPSLARAYYEMMASLSFLPNSPTFTGAGTPLGQLAACFVLPIDDDMGRDSPNGIFCTLKNAALIQQTGGGIGFSFSRLRPKGDIVNKSKGTASGPISFLKVYDAAFNAIAQGGTRRGANMCVLRVDHPDIEEFIKCKSVEGNITSFNISVGITSKFMNALGRENTDFDLVNPRTGYVVKTIKADKLMNDICQLAHHNGEPGVLFIDTANRTNPVASLYNLESTNPCGKNSKPTKHTHTVNITPPQN